jgi:RNA polymerase sigma factor (sigma-70 family)
MMKTPGPTGEMTDQDLISIYRESGRREAVGELFRRYARFVFLVCMKYLRAEEAAKDASMEIFENLFSGLKKHEINNFKPWLHAVARNHCLLRLREEKRDQRMTESFRQEVQGDMESGYVLHHQEDAEQRLKNLEGAILMLSKEQRVCIELFYLKKRSYHEIVELTGNTFQQVKSHIQNGKRNLRNLMNERHE